MTKISEVNLLKKFKVEKIINKNLFKSSCASLFVLQHVILAVGGGYPCPCDFGVMGTSPGECA